MIGKEEATITLQEFLEQEAELEAAAIEALPGKFDECTYGQGYINQPVFVCLSCVKHGEEAGICYSCSIACHTQCELIELMGRRSFRCDCGNSKFQRNS